MEEKERPKNWLFTKDNYPDTTKWTEEACHKLLDELEDWLFQEVPILNDKGEIVGYKDAGNCFFREFIYKKKIYDTSLNHIRNKYDSVSKRFEDIDKIQEHKLQLLAAKGAHKENITKFILTNKYGWRERSENTNNQIISDFNIKNLISFEDDDSPKDESTND